MNTEHRNKKILNSEKEYKDLLILHNDDIHSFDEVIEYLQEICGHTVEQAEQCALIAHYNGKCDIKSGNYDDLIKLRNKFNRTYLTTTIE